LYGLPINLLAGKKLAINKDVDFRPEIKFLNVDSRNAAAFAATSFPHEAAGD